MNIYDIAKRSGVSIATVSRVLNGGKNVSNKTRERVLAVMQEEDYTPNIFARGLNLNSMKMVGILCTDVSDAFYAKAVSLVEGLLRLNGFDALLCCTGNNLEDKKKYLDLLLTKRVDAVILIGSAFREAVDNSHIENAAKQVPVIIINGLVELPNTYCVLCDEHAAVSRNVRLLHNQGINEILYLYDILTYSGNAKLSGFKDGLNKCHIPVKDSHIVMVKKSIDDVAGKVSELIQSGLEFQAVLASEDIIAIGALKALQKAGLEMPIIGFNNSLLAQCSTPSLTSVDNMLDTMCLSAVRLLMDITNGNTVPPRIVVYPKLIERETFTIKNKS